MSSGNALRQSHYEDALAFAEKKHRNQIRIGGAPYITHPIAVADILRDWGYPLEYQITGLFHDLLEDTDASEQEIESIGGAAVLEAVKLLTKQKDYIMADYVSGIKADPMARAVKAADRLHNLRCAVVASEDFKRRYLLESVDWYWDLSPEIPPAAKALAESMETPLPEFPFLYEPIENRIIDKTQNGHNDTRRK